MNSFPEEFQELAQAFKKAKDCNSRGDWQGIGEAFERYESALAMKSLGDSDQGKWLAFGVTFLDCWADCANHAYYYYEPIKKDDWPILADKIIEAIEKEVPFARLELNGRPLKNFDR